MALIGSFGQINKFSDTIIDKVGISLLLTRDMTFQVIVPRETTFGMALSGLAIIIHLHRK